MAAARDHQPHAERLADPDSLLVAGLHMLPRKNVWSTALPWGVDNGGVVALSTALAADRSSLAVCASPPSRLI